MNLLTRTGIVLLVLAAGAGPVFGAPVDGPAENSTRRFGLFIGSNNGGRERIMLRYAVSDARVVSRVFSDMGGIASGDNTLLIEPRLRDINSHITAMNDAVTRARQSYKRTEIVFYYSGHSDEDGLLLGRERLSYRELRERISAIPSDMRIVILDSCASGAFTRAKGGVKTQPFLLDNSSSAEGYAFLTSSSATEMSQESDSIGSSYFTHSLVAGLRGAADTVGDGRVTLNEVYRFAYTETLLKTETSMYGAQHPSYDMQVSGTGDVVLTDIKETSASMIIDQGISGRLSIRDGTDSLIAEITKTQGKAMELGLEPGLYRITLRQGDVFSRAELTLERDQRQLLTGGYFRAVNASAAQARGDAGAAEALSEGAEAAENAGQNAGMEEADPMEQSVLEEARRRAGVRTETSPENRTGAISPPSNNPGLVTGSDIRPFNIQIKPGVNLVNSGSGGNTTNNVLLGLIFARGYDLNGFGMAGIGVINSGSVNGLQMSGIYNKIPNGTMDGVQAAGIFNIAGNTRTGVQAAGIFNITGSASEGVQAAGIYNTARGDLSGVQAAGIYNIAWDDLSGVQAAGIFNLTGGGLWGSQYGLVNISRGNVYGVQAGLYNQNEGGEAFQVGLINVSRGENTFSLGLVNVIKNGILHPAVYLDNGEFMNFSFRSGSKHFYSIVMVGDQGLRFGSDPLVIGRKKEHPLLVSRAGIGFELPLGKKVFLDLDALGGNIIDVDIPRKSGEGVSASVQVRLTAGFKIFKHLGFFAGLSYDYVHRYADNSPSQGGYAFCDFEDGRDAHRMGFFGGLQF
jgi:hypothetical protein